ncbi:MAG: hypothetical protein OXP73_08545 [Chloroflexota bacterium]|nr:hypothetical protein [Chloroflexota bacterium]
MARRWVASPWEIETELRDGKTTSPLVPWAAGQPLPGQARRREGAAPCVIPLAEAVVAALRGDVLEARTGGDASTGLWVRRRPRRHTRGERVLRFAWPRLEGLRRLDADLGLVLLLEAVAERQRATDLLDAWQALLEAWEGAERELDHTLAVPLARAADELWYWLIYQDAEPLPGRERRQTLEVESTCTATPDPASDDLAPLLTDVDALAVYRDTGLVVPSRLPEALTRRVEGATFQGAQLGQLVLAMERGLHAMLVGPRGTGKSLCATEASRYATGSSGRSKAMRLCSRWTSWAAMCRIRPRRSTRSHCRRSWPVAWRWAMTSRPWARRRGTRGPTGR